MSKDKNRVDTGSMVKPDDARDMMASITFRTEVVPALSPTLVGEIAAEIAERSASFEPSRTRGPISTGQTIPVSLILAPACIEQARQIAAMSSDRVVGIKAGREYVSERAGEEIAFPLYGVILRFLQKHAGEEVGGPPEAPETWARWEGKSPFSKEVLPYTIPSRRSLVHTAAADLEVGICTVRLHLTL